MSPSKKLSRREILQTSVVGAAGIGLGATLSNKAKVVAAPAHAITQQLPPPTPLNDPKWACTVTTESSAWQKAILYKPAFSFETLNLNITKPALDAARSELFDPQAGARFTYCRMPIGANDYAREAYSHDETDGDFSMQHFSIAHDKDTLVPF